ncbi:MAG: hypothetical protein KKB51_00825 [Candidatus Riflebacteria bacterium]|nr:hypothetical protein [Candidatus Riflebacteria bacterium]
MKQKLVIFLLILMTTVVVSAQTRIKESPFSLPFTPGKEFGLFEKQRIFVTKSDFDKPVSAHKLYFHIEPVSCDGFPMLDLIVTRNRPCTDIAMATEPGQLEVIELDETTRKYANSGQVIPYIVYWQVRNRDGKVIRQWEPDFRNRLRTDGDEHFRTVYSLPKSDLTNSFLLLYFEDANLDKIRDDVVFEIDIRNLNWPTK